MNRVLVAILLSLGLVACSAVTSVVPSPSAIADRTVLDERHALRVEQVYQASATVVLAANRLGLIPASTRSRIKAADARAYAAVRAVRAAYDASNAKDYAAARTIAEKAVADLLAAVRSS